MTLKQTKISPSIREPRKELPKLEKGSCPSFEKMYHQSLVSGCLQNIKNILKWMVLGSMIAKTQADMKLQIKCQEFDMIKHRHIKITK